jgi:hypothetical protein
MQEQKENAKAPKGMYEQKPPKVQQAEQQAISSEKHANHLLAGLL